MKIRDRIKELRRVRADQLRPHPKNWRTHPEAQRDALKGMLAEVGYADALLARELPDGSLELIDGHLRAETTPDAEVPVLVLDVDEREAAKLLALLDPLAGLAGTDDDVLAGLLVEVETESRAVRATLDRMLKAPDELPIESEPAELQPLDLQQPPPMTWVLLGIPTVRFAEIAETVERLAKVEGIFLESTSNSNLK